MSYRYWGIIFTAIGFLIAFPVSSQEQGEAQDQTGQIEQNSQADTAPELEVIIVPDTHRAYARADEHRQSEPKQQAGESQEALWDWPPRLSSDDTTAQWVMAVFGIIATILSGAAVWLLYLTFRATRDTLREAQAATDVANRAVNLQQLSETAWLSLGRIAATKNNHLDEFLCMAINVYWYNTGRTPAKNCRVYAAYTAVRQGTEADDVVFDPGSYVEIQKPVIGSDTEAESILFIIPKKDALASVRCENWIYVWSKIEFQNVFSDNIQEADICYRIWFGISERELLDPQNYTVHFGYKIADSTKYNKTT